jgi:hypothetical protein
MNRSYQLFFILFLLIYHSYAGYGQNTLADKNSYSVAYSNATLKNILQDLYGKYHFNFSYAGSMLPMDTIVSRQCQSSSVSQFIHCILADLPIKHQVIGNQIVLYRSNLFVKRNTDSLKTTKDSIVVRSLHPKKRTFEIYKISLIDLLYGASLYNSDSLITQPDTLMNLSNLDSIKRKEREVRRKRIRLVRKQYRSNQWGYISFNPELSTWRMRGTTNQSIDYSIFNDYGSSDLGSSLQISYSIRIVKDLFLQAGFLGNYLTKNGKHTDYYVSFLDPGNVEKVQYNYEARFGYANLYFQFGYEYKYALNKVVLAAGGFSGILVRNVSPKLFPYYETKYYVDGPPYFNANYERIEREAISYRKIVPGLMAEGLYFKQIMPKTDFVLGIHARYITHSIYNRDEPISEKAFTAGISLGLRYNFK